MTDRWYTMKDRTELVDLSLEERRRVRARLTEEQRRCYEEAARVSVRGDEIRFEFKNHPTRPGMIQDVLEPAKEDPAPQSWAFRRNAIETAKAKLREAIEAIRLAQGTGTPPPDDARRMAIARTEAETAALWLNEVEE